MKFANLGLAVMFLLFAFVQINDPDPALWIAIYGIMALVCIMAAYRYYIKPLIVVMAVSFMVYMILLYPGVSEWMKQPDRSILFDDVLKMQHPYIEESREFLGLLICEMVLIVYIIRSKAYKTLN